MVKVIGNLRKGTLTSLGYSSSKGPTTRHTALNKAIKKYGKNGVIHKLNAVSVLTRNTNPTVSNIFNVDMKWVEQK